jgi:hypothetical protein
MRQGCLLSLILFNTAKAIRKEQEIKRIEIGEEEVKQSILVDDMILYLREPKNCTKKLLESLNFFGKVGGYKINIQKQITFLNTTTNRL